MRIPLTVAKFYSERKLVFASFFIQIPSMRVAHGLNAVVDSGSPFTSISTRDAIAFNLPISNWQKGELSGLAASKFYRHSLEATLSFHDADANVVHFRQAVSVLVPTNLNKKSLDDVQNVPSLIGTDFLEDHGLTFVYNPSALSAYFEKADAPSPALTAPAGTTS